MSGRSFVDTNVLAYVFDDAEAAKQTLARQLLAEAPPGSLVLSAQVLNEFFVVATRKLGVSVRDAERAVAGFARLQVVPLDAGLVLAAVDRVRVSQLSLWDALIIEAARSAGCDRVLTEDLDAGQRLDGVQITDPFGSPDG